MFFLIPSALAGLNTFFYVQSGSALHLAAAVFCGLMAIATAFVEADR